ncbi:recombinase family protein [Nonomuraea dietziae]
MAGTYHTGRFTKVPPAGQAAARADSRGPGQPWRPGTPPPAPVDPDRPSAGIRIGYARRSALTQELQSLLDAPAAHSIDRERIFAEKISTRVKVRPRFEAALALARQIKAHAPHCRVILTVYAMKRLGRDAAELTALADHLTAHGLVLEMLAGPLAGIYDPSGPGSDVHRYGPGSRTQRNGWGFGQGSCRTTWRRRHRRRWHGWPSGVGALPARR